MSAARTAVFLDRDGTLNNEVDFVRTPEELHLIPGAADAVRRLHEAGLITCLMSNQSGIARGFLTEEMLQLIHAKLTAELAAEGARLDALYYCPHYPEGSVEPYNVTCSCRKPAPGMILRGAAEFGLDLSASFVVGDSAVDVLAGRAAGATSLLVLTGYGRRALQDERLAGVRIDHVVDDLPAAATRILEILEERRRA